MEVWSSATFLKHNKQVVLTHYLQTCCWYPLCTIATFMFGTNNLYIFYNIFFLVFKQNARFVMKDLSKYVRNGPLPSLQVNLIWKVSLLTYTIWINKSIFTQWLKNEKCNRSLSQCNLNEFQINIVSILQINNIIITTKCLQFLMLIMFSNNVYLQQLMRNAKQKWG